MTRRCHVSTTQIYDHRRTRPETTRRSRSIESMGRNEKRELVNRLEVLVTHLLKWQYQPECRGTSEGIHR